MHFWNQNCIQNPNLIHSMKYFPSYAKGYPDQNSIFVDADQKYYIKVCNIISCLIS